MKSGMTFDHAVAPASWTLPSHASLFTGRQPWEHGVLTTGSSLPPNIPTLAEDASAHGYTTGSFSANPYLSDTTQLTRGFRTALWGAIEDCVLRGCMGLPGPKGRVDSQLGMDPPHFIKSTLRTVGLPSFLSGIQRVGPLVPYALSRILGLDAQLTDGGIPLTSPWLERCVQSWLRVAPRENPVLCFVNLLDAHEPYFSLLRPVKSITDVLHSLRAHRAAAALSKGVRDGLAPELAQCLHDAYRSALHVLDSRLGCLTAIFQSLRDPDNLLVVFVGDHGQAFGEEGTIYHGYGTVDTLFRVPMIIGSMKRQSHGQIVREWISTTEVARILSSAIGYGKDWLTIASFPKVQPIDSEIPVWAIGSLSRKQILESDRIGLASPREGRSLVGYCGKRKVTLDTSTGKLLSIRSISDEGLSSNNVVDAAGSKGTWLAHATKICRLLGSANSVNKNSPIPNLESWGY